jgi:uncharacterized protein YjbJ (UPF0337 family)
MNKDQVNGAIKGVLGKAQTRAGKRLHGSSQAGKGLLTQAEGRMQKAYGDLKAALKNSRHS